MVLGRGSDDIENRQIERNEKDTLKDALTQSKVDQAIDLISGAEGRDVADQYLIQSTIKSVEALIRNEPCHNAVQGKCCAVAPYRMREGPYGTTIDFPVAS